MISKHLTILFGSACLLACLAAPAAAEMLVPGPHVEFLKSVTVGSSTGISTVAGLSFDPSYKNGEGNYDRVYMVNRVVDADVPNRRGLYSAVISTGTVTGRLALTGTTGSTAMDEPYDSVVDSSGNVYVCYSGTQAVYKVTNPLGTPTQTKILGNYGFNTSGSPSDDDPAGIDIMPSGFGVAGYGAGDLLLLDSGLDWNEREALSAVSKNSLSTNQIYQNIWNDGDPVGGNSNDVHGKVSIVDNKFYFSRTTIPTITVGAASYPAIYRVGGDGVLETIALNLPAGETFTSLDDSMTVNPADGSVWLIKDDPDLRRAVLRVDMASAVSQGGGVYLANATAEITWAAADNFNVGVNDMAWSPDGKFLAIGNPSGTDKLYVFEAIPEPAMGLLMAIGAMLLAMFRRRR